MVSIEAAAPSVYSIEYATIDCIILAPNTLEFIQSGHKVPMHNSVRSFNYLFYICADLFCV
jgi:hypothetical protein